METIKELKSKISGIDRQLLEVETELDEARVSLENASNIKKKIHAQNLRDTCLSVQHDLELEKSKLISQLEQAESVQKRAKGLESLSAQARAMTGYPKELATLETEFSKHLETFISSYFDLMTNWKNDINEFWKTGQAITPGFAAHKAFSFVDNQRTLEAIPEAKNLMADLQAALEADELKAALTPLAGERLLASVIPDSLLTENKHRFLLDVLEELSQAPILKNFPEIAQSLKHDKRSNGDFLSKLISYGRTLAESKKAA